MIAQYEGGAVSNELAADILRVMADSLDANGSRDFAISVSIDDIRHLHGEPTVGVSVIVDNEAAIFAWLYEALNNRGKNLK